MSDVVLVGGYRPDGLRSMEDYSRQLHSHLRSTDISSEMIHPIPLLGRRLPGRGAGKVRTTLRELDRFVVTPLAWMARKFKVLHITDHANAFLLRHLTYRRAIVTVHDLVPLLLATGRLRGPKQSLKRRYLVHLSMTALSRADAVVCVSQTTKHDLKTLLGIEPSKILVIENMPFQTVWSPLPSKVDSLRRELRVQDQDKIILHVGSNIFRKNRINVIKVFCLLARNRRNVRLMLVGSPLDKSEAKIVPAELIDRIIIRQNISSDDISAVYAISHVMLFPSIYEGFGLPILEAQSCGLPVVCSNGGALPEVASDGAIICDPYNVDQLADAVEMLFDCYERRQLLIERGYRNLRRYDMDLWWGKYFLLYKGLI
jgi:glycosyltransferase involved in cell wall biosynthesis